MSDPAYHFVTRWRVRGSIEEVADVLSDARDLPRWWPAVYVEVVELTPGDERRIGATYALDTKGWLPYRLRWQLRVTASNSPHGFSIAADGDFVGRGVWTLAQDGEIADIAYDWNIRAAKPLLRRLSFLLRPVFAANHRWAMAVGERSLRLELARRRATTPAQRERVPPPPGPTFAFLLRGRRRARDGDRANA